MCRRRANWLTFLIVPVVVMGCGTVKGSPTPISNATPSALTLSVSNGTTIRVILVVNGATVATVLPGAGHDPIEAALPALPWTVEARSPSGRVLSTMTVRAGDARQTTIPGGGVEKQGDFARADLSCGRLDVWAGEVRPLGPPPDPNASHPPGDSYDAVAGRPIGAARGDHPWRPPIVRDTGWSGMARSTAADSHDFAGWTAARVRLMSRICTPYRPGW